MCYHELEIFDNKPIRVRQGRVSISQLVPLKLSADKDGLTSSVFSRRSGTYTSLETLPFL